MRALPLLAPLGVRDVRRHPIQEGAALLLPEVRGHVRAGHRRGARDHGEQRRGQPAADPDGRVHRAAGGQGHGGEGPHVRARDGASGLLPPHDLVHAGAPRAASGGAGRELPARVPLQVQGAARLPEAGRPRRVHLRALRAGVRPLVPRAQPQPRVHLVPRLGPLLRPLSRERARLRARRPPQHGLPQHARRLPAVDAHARLQARAHLG
mmetsp:Transcript_27549/g.69743  ORF Transcript_27549/g.69743 Transcript_27549/m.69743 type:complete len:209 (+) Transcript_27549:965-1591(+)